MADHAFEPEDDLIGKVACGDREAFAALYRRCRPDVYRFAVHMCGSPAVAEDVVQDVFVAVIEDAARYRPGHAGVVPWLLGIARNHVRRWQQRRLFLPLPDDETATARQLAVHEDPLRDLARERQHVAMARALLDLPAPYREAIVLCDLQQFSYEQAADALGCAIGTVRSRLHRGRALLAHAVSDVRRDVMRTTPAARSL